MHRRLGTQGISFSAAGLSWRPAWERFAAFSRGQHPLRAAQCSLLAPSPELAPSGGWGSPRTPPHPARTAPCESSTTAVTYSGRGLAPQLGAGWSRDQITWSGADKRPLGRRTRNLRQLPPSGDSWEPGANLRGQPVPALSVRRRPSANELHQVGSLREPRGACSCGEIGLRFPSALSANADPIRGHVD